MPSPEHKFSSDRLAQALQHMYRRRITGIKYDLEPVHRLMQQLDNPHHALAAIHVAGTNGKGSVCAMIEAVLRVRGVRPALYTSPHLLRFNERIQIAGIPISDDQLGPLIECVEKADRAAAAVPGGRPATFFEFSTALAFLYFKQQAVRIAVIETGLGGRLDATNVLTPILSVITRIGLDHSQWLGTDLATVAAEKAGIIKPQRPVVCGAMPAATRAVIDRISAERQAPLIAAEQTVSVQPVRGRHGDPEGRITLAGSLMDYGVFKPALTGGYQLENMATAVAALEMFGRVSGVSLDAKTMTAGLSRVSWPARLQRIGDDPPVILDGAHNPDAVAALMRSVSERWKKQPVALVTGICDDKDYRAMLRCFKRRVRRCWTVPFSVERSLDPHQLAQAARQLGEDWEVSAASLEKALEAATVWAREQRGIVVIAGSLFLAAEVMKRKEFTEYVAKTYRDSGSRGYDS